MTKLKENYSTSCFTDNIVVAVHCIRVVFCDAYDIFSFSPFQVRHESLICWAVKEMWKVQSYYIVIIQLYCIVLNSLFNLNLCEIQKG